MSFIQYCLAGRSQPLNSKHTPAPVSDRQELSRAATALPPSQRSFSAAGRWTNWFLS